MWGRIVSSVSNALDFNQATLSGSIDILVVPQGGSKMTDEKPLLRSTPFHVRFGKAKLLRSREKIVKIAVNDEETDLTMKLGSAGEAYFLEPTEGTIDADGETSPFNSPSLSPKRDATNPPLEEGSASTATLPKAIHGSADSECCLEPKTSTSRPNMDNSYTVVTGSPGSAGATTNNYNENNRLEKVDSSPSICQVSGGNENASTVGVSPLGFQSFESSDPNRQIAFSLCGHLLYASALETAHNEEVFNANILTWEQFDANPSLWYDTFLVARFGQNPIYYPGKIALPLLASWTVFNRPHSLSAIDYLTSATLTLSDPPRERLWDRWWGGGRSSTTVIEDSTKPNQSSVVHPPYTQQSEPIINNENERGSGIMSSENPNVTTSGQRYRKSLRPSSEQLLKLKLKPGANKVTFSVTSSFQGCKYISATIYYWPSDAKIVVSDVDGTITRSDVLGQLMPIVGRDWSHNGVAELYSKIRQNGYYILYLTARAIGQADSTRDYLFGLTQKSKEKLPDGPLVLSPDRLFPSFKREVIDRKPFIFKIAALRDIRNLFPKNHNPYYAGFGNRDSDHRAYVHVGIPEGKVFIIDPNGMLHHVNTTYAKTYETMSQISEHMFPPLASCNREGEADEGVADNECNNANYWRIPLELQVCFNFDDLTIQGRRLGEGTYSDDGTGVVDISDVDNHDVEEEDENEDSVPPLLEAETC